MKTMKTNTIILIASMLIACVMPATAQINWKSTSPKRPNTAQPIEWQSSAVMQNTGSKFTPQVIAVDAPEATYQYLPMQSTSTMMETGYVPTPDIDMTSNGRQIRKGFDTGGETGGSSESPIGEPWSLLLLAAAAAGVIAYRRRMVKVSTIADGLVVEYRSNGCV